MLSRLLASSLALVGALACSVTNRDHCGNLDGDATCSARDADRRYCSLCVADNDGCVDAPVADAACRAESGAVTTAADSTGPVTSTSGSTTDLTTGSSSSSGPDVIACGDGVAEGMENCDGDDFRGKKCDDFEGYGGGTLMCEDCKYNYAECCLLPGLTCEAMSDCCPGTECKLDVLMAKMTCQ